jgi:hypothetical protein
MLDHGPQEAGMGRYVILLIAPMVIGFLLAAVVLALSALRQRRIEAYGELTEESLAEPAQPPAEPAAREASARPRRRIA